MMENAMKEEMAHFSQARKARRHGEEGWIATEGMGTYTFYMIMFAAAVVVVVFLLSDSKLTKAQNNLMSIRMKITTAYAATGGNYEGLDVVEAKKAGIIPKNMLRGDTALTPWGGEVGIAQADGDTSSFTITFNGVPEKECVSLSLFQREVWDSVTVNGNEVDTEDSLATAGGYCQPGRGNVLAYTGR